MDISFMKSAPWFAPIVKRKQKKNTYYRYEDDNFSIFSSTNLNQEEAEKFKYAIQALRKFKGLPHIEEIEKLLPKLNQSFAPDPKIEDGEIVAFDKNIYLKGIEHFSELFRLYIKERGTQNIISAILMSTI